MCGICGTLYVERPANRAELTRMCEVITHRGPDEDGFLLQENIGLAMRRLKIIDLNTGAQPIFNETQSVAIVFNGEIYNYQPLRHDLQAKGHVFRTQTDTEVIVHAYEEYGTACIEKLNGMFALAIWDSNTQQVLLARDRAGQKPLFYYHTPQGDLLFASEIKALLANEQVPRQMNHNAVYHYLSTQYIMGPETILQDVYQLPAGHIGIWQAGELQIKQYWHPTYESKPSYTEAEWIVRTRETVTAAVERHLMSDVPLGAYLSGGVDSSVIVAVMSQLASGRVKTFSIGFDVDAYSETSHARRVADRFQTDHHEFIVSAQDVTNTLEDVVYYADQPLADTSCMATYLLAKLTRQHVTVALTGDGGDEAFAGYTRYTLDRLLRYYRLLPSVARTRLIPAAASLLPERADIPTDRNIVTGIKRLAQASTTTHKASILAWGSFFTEEQKRWLAEPDWLDCLDTQPTPALLAADYDRAHAHTHLDRTLHTDFVRYLQDDLLVKADRMSMAHSLETRAPFLDNDVLALGQHMPARMRIQGRTQKYALRQAFADMLPTENIQRIKRGFGMPVASWLRGHMRQYTEDILLDPQTTQRGYFHPAHLEAMLRQHRRYEADHGQRLWAILVLELWQRHFLL